MSSNNDNTEELEEGSRSLLLAIVSQLAKGSDLQRIALPTFVLEPRSMLERITDFMSHPDLLWPACTEEDKEKRFIAVLRYYLSGWHIKPKGVKKPYNPVLGEFFRCRYSYPDGKKAFYIAEQVSHHPPISAYYYTCPELGIVIHGDIRPKSKFFGTKAGTYMEGTSWIILPNKERYEIKMPNIYARGVLFGTMTLELGDSSKLICKSSQLACELEFTSKGYFSGLPNSVSGKIIKESPKETLYEISGQWSDKLTITNKKTGEKEILFDVETSEIREKTVDAIDNQEEYESRRLWSDLTEAIRKTDMDKAKEAKERVEDRQRELAKEREEMSEKWKGRFFEEEFNDVYSFKGRDLEGKALEEFIFAKTQNAPINVPIVKTQ